MSEPRPDTGTRCPTCDAERPPTAAAGAAVLEPVTHCEWCGAEYPVPQDEPDPPGA